MTSNNSLSSKQNSEYMRTSILNKLHEMTVQQSDADMLTEFILVLMASQKSSQEMAKELSVFLEDGIKAAEYFVSWLTSIQEKSITIVNTKHIKDQVVDANSKRESSSTMQSRHHREYFHSNSKEDINDLDRTSRRSRLSSGFNRRKDHRRRSSDNAVSFTVSLENDRDAYSRSEDRGHYQSHSRNRSRSIDKRDSIRHNIIEPLPKSRKFSTMINEHQKENVNEASVLKKSIPCLYFPSCNLGDSCPYSHDASLKKEDISLKSAMSCKFDRLCKNPSCPYIHSSPATTVPSINSIMPTTEVCRYFPWCGRGDGCSYVHPSPPMPTTISALQSKPAVPCRYGPLCARVDCIFLHPTIDSPSMPCRFGSACARPFCVFQHTINSPSSSIGTASNDAMDSTFDKPSFLNSETITSPPGSPFLLALSDG